MLVSLIVFVFVTLGSCDPCNEGQSYWCKDYDTATECGVLELCRLEQGFKEMSKGYPSPVSVELYYESFCEGCRTFILGQLWPTFQALKNSGIMEVKLYPYGNAFEKKVDGKWQFTCQHGKVECEMNLIETRAIHILGHANQFMEYIHCVETTPSLVNAKVCADQLKIDWGSILNCYKSTEGNLLEHDMAVATNALNPPHNYVPWLVGNGQHNEELEDDMLTNLMEWVCQTYEGVKPHACRTMPQQRCYRTDHSQNIFTRAFEKA